MKNLARPSLLFLFPLFFGSFSSVADHATTPDPCVERRGAFDVSSEGIRIRVADINTCESREFRVVLDLEDTIPFKKRLVAVGGKSFPPDVISQGTITLRKFADAARKLDPKPVALRAIATGAFRQADNAAVFLKAAKDLGISLKILTPEEEAILSYRSAQSVLPAGSQNFVVWSIGGASQQFAVKKEGQGFQTFSDSLGAVTFRSMVSRFKGLPPEASPNPLTLQEVSQADSTISKNSSVTVSSALKQVIASRAGQVVGVGGVLAESLPSQTQKTEYSIEDLDQTIKERAGLFDGQIGGKYSDTQTTNLVLVRGIMRSLGIEKVRALTVRNHMGLLVQNDLWNGKSDSRVSD